MNDLPIPLRRKLVFGDREQINALRKLEIEAQKEHDEKERGNTKYTVYIEAEGEITETIWANSAKEAERQAKEGIDIEDFDIYISARAVKT